MPSAGGHRPRTEPALTSSPGTQAPRTPRPRRRSPAARVLGWIGLGLLGILGMAAGAAGVLVATLPDNFIRDRVVAEVNARTGRTIEIAGRSSFQLYPSIGISIGDVTVSGAPGVGEATLVRMDNLDVSVRLLPLLRREVRIERLVLRKPVLTLAVDASGRRSWDMAAAHVPVRVAQAAAPVASDAPGGAPSDPPAASLGGGPVSALNVLELGDVRIEDGTVRYSDARSGARQEASAVNVSLGLQSLAKPLVASGDLVWRGEKVTLEATLTSPETLLAKRPAKLSMKLAGRPVSGSYDGSLVLREVADAEGAINLTTASVKDLAKWVGTELPSVPGLGALELKGQARVAGRTFTLSNAAATLDGATLSGQVSVDTAPARPYVTGTLSLSELILDKYIGGKAGAASDPAPPAAPADEGRGGTKSIESLIESAPAAPPGPKVKGYTQRAGWSEGRIDASALGLIDAELKLTLGKLTYDRIKVGQSKLAATLRAAALKVVFDEVQLYEGRGQGFLSVDGAAADTVAVSTNLTLDGVAAGPLLKDAADMDWLAGKGRLTLVCGGQGQNQRQIVETLTGKASLSVANGAIVGWNVAGIVRNVMQGKLSGLDRQPSEKTDFSELSSTWTITNGLAENQDLRLQSPLLRVTGAGNVMLPAREIDYLLRPVLVSSLEGQGATAPANGIEVPVRVQGSWDKPRFTPDASQILKDPNKALETVKQLGKQFKGKSADEIVKGLLGGKKGTSEGQAAPETGEKPKSQQLLEQLLR